MIKAIGSIGKQPLLMLGLSGENVTRLAAGEPIRFNMAEIGLEPREVVIFYGKTEEDCMQQLREVGLV